RLRAEWEAGASGQVIDVMTAMRKATLQVIMRTMCSFHSDHVVDVIEHEFGHYQASVQPNLLDVMGLPDRIAGWGRRRAARRAFAKFDEVMNGVIADRLMRPDAPGEDLLGRLVAGDKAAGLALTPAEIRDEVVTIFMAGHDTTAIA